MITKLFAFVGLSLIVMQTMADELEAKCLKQRQLCSQVGTSKTICSARMREIAHTALQLSDDDIDDFFSDHKTPPSCDVS